MARKPSPRKLSLEQAVALLESIVDHHIHFVVYALQDAESVSFMRQLKWTLQQEHVAAQEVVLIEQVPVQFVEAAELTA